MGLLEAIVLGVVQGLTEFIPVSSSGHLVFVPWLLHWSKPALVFDTTLHLGTLLALLIYFWRDIWEVIVAWLGGWSRRSWSEPAARLGWLIIVGTIPAAVAGLALQDQFEALFGEPGFVGGALVATGFILALSEWVGRRRLEMEKLGFAGAIVAGVAQAVAITPGISRSGATISAGLWLGLKRPAAARFSFLLSMPIIAGAGLSQLVSLLRGHEPVEARSTALVVGFLAAVISGYLCIRFLLSYLQRGTLYVFAAYCWAIGLLVIVLWNLTGGKGLG